MKYRFLTNPLRPQDIIYLQETESFTTTERVINGFKYVVGTFEIPLLSDIVSCIRNTNQVNI